MPYIYRNDDKTYYNLPKKIWVELLSEASKFKNHDTATNTINNNPVLKELLAQNIIIITEHDICLMTEQEANESFFQLQKNAEAFGEIAQKISSMQIYYNNIVSEQDKIQQDILHKFEFTKPHGLTYFKLGKMLHECREKRREAKDALMYLASLSTAKSDTVYQIHTDIVETLEKRKYRPRALPELFK